MKKNSRTKDRTGDVHGILRVVEFVGTNEYGEDKKKGNALWRCVCECGNERILSSAQLGRKRYPIRSCGCTHHNGGEKGREANDLLGKTFGRLTVIERAGSDKFGHSKWLCQCECGNFVEALGDNLIRRGGSCGCLNSELSAERLRKIAKANCGPKGPGWKGGVYPKDKLIRGSIEYLTWKDEVKKRDNYVCQQCGERNKEKMHSHHVKSFQDYPELRFDVDNGKTLCNTCHMTLHAKLRKRNPAPQK